MRSSARSSRVRFGLVFSAIASIAAFAAACGPSPAGQKVGTNGTTPPPEETLVVALPEPTTSSQASAVETPPDPGSVPSRPVAAAGPLEPCIAKLRADADGPDPSKATGTVEYHDALAAEMSGKKDVARKGYLGLIQNNPQSTLVPAAYFAFGELFLEEMRSDPAKTAFAEQSYKEVLKYPAPQSRFPSVANLRLGQALKISRPVEALSAFSKAVKAEHDGTFAAVACRAEAAAAALAETVDVFVNVGDAKKSWAFYLGLTGDGARTAAVTLKLAQRYVAAKKGQDAADTLAASVELGAKAQPEADARASYCKDVRAAAEGARKTGGATTSLDKALATACP